MKYIKIKDWERYQSRDHKKSWPWIKLYQESLDNEVGHELTTYQFGVMCKLMLLQARLGVYPALNQSYLRSKLKLTKPLDVALFERLGLIEIVSARPERVQGAPSPRLEEREREREKRGEEKRGEEIANKCANDALELEKQSALDGSKEHSRKRESKCPDLVKLWNENRGDLPETRQDTVKRRKLWQSRWKEKPDREYWQTCVRKLSESKFCRGDNDRGWVATVDFLLRPDTHVKVYENRYADKESTNETKYVPALTLRTSAKTTAARS